MMMMMMMIIIIIMYEKVDVTVCGIKQYTQTEKLQEIGQT